MSSDGSDPPLSLRWVGQEHLDDVRATVAVGRARDWESFREALRDWSVAIFNFGYADATGRVGYQCAGRVPIRGRTVRGYRDANNAEDSWQGYVPFDDLPRMIDPSRGYVASANERVAPDDYPYALYGSFGSGHRAARIHQVLGTDERLDREQHIALQNDTASCRAEGACPPLLRWLDQTSDADADLLRSVLTGWDYRYTLDSPAPTVFETFMHLWQARVAGERFPAELVDLVKAAGGVAFQLLERGDDLGWFTTPVATEIWTIAARTVQQLRTGYGPTPADWHWRKVHQAHWHHPVSQEFDIGPQPVDGGPDCLRNTGCAPDSLAATSGAEYRLVFDFAEPTKLLAVQNIGNSGVPGNPHYTDQFEDWLAGRYHTVSLSHSEVVQDAESRTTLEPPDGGAST